MPSETIRTPLTELLKIRHPVLLAGMNGVSHGELAAAVSNAGGLGVIGGFNMSPDALRKDIAHLKQHLVDKSAPFGVDLLLPKVGEGARATNYDYTKGQLPELIDIIIQEKASVFVSAVGVPPSWAVEKLHAAGILCGNMVGAPHHADKAVAAGMDFVIAQGGEAGGHTGEIGTMVLIRQVVEAVEGKTSAFTKKPIMVCAAGGIADGQAVAAALSLGAAAVWVGTRFIVSTESAAGPRHVQAVLNAKALDTVKTLHLTGRPLRALMTPHVKSWVVDRKDLLNQLTSKGIIPMVWEAGEMEAGRLPQLSFLETFPLLLGQAAGNRAAKTVKPAAAVVEELVADAIATMRKNSSLISKL